MAELRLKACQPSEINYNLKHKILMFKSFIISLIPVAVIARGDNDGSSAENAVTVPMEYLSENGV